MIDCLVSHFPTIAASTAVETAPTTYPTNPAAGSNSKAIRPNSKARGDRHTIATRIMVQTYVRAA